MGRLERGLRKVKKDISGLKEVQIPRQLDELEGAIKESIDRLTAQVTEQGQSLNQLNNSVTDQEKRLDNLTSTQQQSNYIVRPSKNDAQPITIASGKQHRQIYNFKMHPYAYVYITTVYNLYTHNSPCKVEQNLELSSINAHTPKTINGIYMVVYCIYGI